MKEIVIFLPPSLITLLLLKFLVVMLCAIYDNVMRFHERFTIQRDIWTPYND